MPQAATIWAQPRAPTVSSSAAGGGRPSWKGRSSAAAGLSGAHSDVQDPELQGAGATGAYGAGPPSGGVPPGGPSDDPDRPSASRRFMGWLLNPQGQAPARLPPPLFTSPSLPAPFLSPGGSTRVSHSGVAGGTPPRKTASGAQEQHDIEAGVAQQQGPRLSSPGLSLARLLSLQAPPVDGVPETTTAASQQQQGQGQDGKDHPATLWLGYQSTDDEGQGGSGAETYATRSRYMAWGLDTWLPSLRCI
jgi:hypothetical protein